MTTPRVRETSPPEQDERVLIEEWRMYGLRLEADTDDTAVIVHTRYGPNLDTRDIGTVDADGVKWNRNGDMEDQHLRDKWHGHYLLAYKRWRAAS